MIHRLYRALALRLFCRLPIDIQLACALRYASETGYTLSKPRVPETMFSDRNLPMFLRRQA